jgi:predicted dehydrogenase
MSTATIGRKNWQAIKNSGDGCLVAVASRNLASSQAFIDECQSTVPFAQSPRAIEGYQELLDQPDVDAVYIPLPTGLRKEWVIRAAESGKHVMCEKPCAINAADLREMIDACQAHDVQFMDGVMFMHSKRLTAMRTALDSGTDIGQLRRITSQLSFNGGSDFEAANIRTNSLLEPHGCLGDLGWYTIRLSLWAMNYAMPMEVVGRLLQGFQRGDSPRAVPIEISGELFFGEGVSASFYTSFVTEHQQWANISGTGGQMYLHDFVLPYSGNQLRYFVTQSDFAVEGCDFSMAEHRVDYVNQEAANSGSDSQETNLFRRFSQIVKSGRLESHWPEIAMKTQRILDAVMESAENGSRPVKP